MIDEKSDITFSKFYLIEFINQTLKKGADNIPEKHFSVLKELSGFLLKEKNIIDGLEILAQYQGTNELAIFLFDMTDRIDDYAPDMIFGTIPDLVDDFINIYNLMMEDSESLQALNLVLAKFHEKYPEVKEEVPEAEVEPGKAFEEELFTFEEFYRQEVLNRFEEILDELNSEEKKTNYLAIIKLFDSINRETNADELSNYEDSITNLLGDLNQIIPREISEIPAGEAMTDLDEKTKQFVRKLENFEKNNLEIFNEILTTHTIPHKKKEVEAEIKIQREEIPEKPITIDNLLMDYFKSEVEDYVKVLRNELDKAKNESDNVSVLQEIIKQFKSLKEVSMIHGYNGMEHLCTNLIFILMNAQENNLTFTDDSYNIFDSFFKELMNVEQFTTIKKDDKQIATLNDLIENLRGTFAKPEIAISEEKIEEEVDLQQEEKAVEEVEEAESALKEEQVAEIEQIIPFTDKPAIYSILQELFKQVYKKIKKYHSNLKYEKTVQNLSQILNSLKNSTVLVQSAFQDEFFEPMQKAYQLVAKQEGDPFSSGLGLINEIWQKFIESVRDPLDLSELVPMFNSIWELEKKEELYSLEDDDKIAGALAEVQKANWQKNKRQLKTALLENKAADKETLLNYFQNLNGNLNLLDYKNYISAIESFIEIIENDQEVQFTEQLVFELEKSMELILDRINSQGKNGSVDDIISVLEELINEQVASRKEIAEVEPEKELEEEEDVEQIFITETQQHIDRAKEALFNLEKDVNDRQQFIQIENAVHSIRSSAHLLNKRDIADLASLVEEVVEIFGRSSIPIPDNLIPQVKSGVEKLNELVVNPETEVDEITDSLQQVLDQIVIEDIQPAEDDEKKAEVAEEQIVTEKPLFAEKEDMDEDLLQIFQEEAKNFLSIIDDSNKKLLKNFNDQEALDRFEYAAHSLMSAAKMLGFREIGQITDSLEDIIEAIKSNEIKNTTEIQNSISEAIQVVKQLSQGEKVPSGELARIINLLDISDVRIEAQPVTEEEEVEETSEAEEVDEIFIEEATELLNNLNIDLIELEKIPESETLFGNIMRNLHTLKGGAMMVKYEKIGELSHKLEDYFQFYKQQNVVLKQEMLNPAFSVLDLIQELLNSIKAGRGEDAAQFTSRLAEIDNKLFLFQAFEYESDETKSTVQAETKPSKAVTKTAMDEENIIKINTSHLDSLVNMATELVVNRTELATYFDNLKNLITKIETDKKQIHNTESLFDDIIEEQKYEEQRQPVDEKITPELKEKDNLQNISVNFKDIVNNINSISTELNKLSQGFEKNINRISNLSKVLHNDILRVRMVPIEHLFNRFPRAVRDLARSQGKRINLVIEGNEAEMDRAMVGALVDPILHLIRNAIDHGIETKEVRSDLNKNKTGKIILRARQDKSQVVIDVEDDGQGIDLQKVREKIIQNKLASKKDIAQMSEAEVLDYLFYPEFTTRDEATEVSGRGIGLDVVANQIQKLKGNIRIKTEKNIGTTFSIRVPLTLVISQALMTKCQEQSIAIPLTAVQESIEIKRDDILVDDNKKYIQVRGKLLPFVTIDELLHFEDSEQIGTVDHPIVLILHDAGVSIALGIKEITGKQEIVIKALGSHLQNVEYIAGGAILGNGEVALILDYAAVIRTIEFQFFGSVTDTYSIRKARKKKVKTKTKPQPRQKIEKIKPVTQKLLPKKIIKGRKARILIVDDSSSVRNFVCSVLENNGYSTLKSSNGETAINMVENDVVDLIITDLEMPKMHGFELISKIREQECFNELPIVILTGRVGQGQQKKGEELGANAFIGKPFKESDLLNVVADFIKMESKK